jgi:hypothetical protein
MGNNRDKKYYNEYISALKKLIDAQNKAREFFPLVPLRPTDEPQELTLQGRRVFQRLKKAYKVYSDKSKAWRNYLKVNGM